MAILKYVLIVIVWGFTNLECSFKNRALSPSSKLLKITKSKNYSDIIFYFDSLGYSRLIENEKEENLKSLVYGVFFSDTLLKRPGSILAAEVPSCANVMINELKKKEFHNYVSNTELEVNKFFLSHHLISIKNFKPLNINDYKDKPMVVLLYTVNFGKRFDSFYKNAISICKQFSSSPIIVTLDPIYFRKI